MSIAIEATLPSPNDPRELGGLLCLVEGMEMALPLLEVRVRARITGVFCTTVVEQVFEHIFDDSVEALHIFPLPESGAVRGMELHAGDLVVRAECREKEEAKQIFESAREIGHRAALLTAERDDVHILRVTNLPAGERVRVRFEVIEQLETVDGAARWRFPTVIAPRYLPGVPTGHAGIGTLPDTDRVPDASHLQPPLRLEGGAALDLEVQIAGPVRGVESSLHAVSLTLEDGCVRVSPHGTATLDRDFVLAITTAADHAVGAQAWTDGTHTLVQVDPPVIALPTPLARDAVFVVDISGSMQGEKMRAAKQALTAALHGLLPGDRFLLIAFDDRVEMFSHAFSTYDDRTLSAADRWIASLAPRGGTEMLAPIQHALAGDTPTGRIRTVLFITDGQVWNEAELVAAVANRRGRARFFSLGIDTAVNGALLGKLARVGGGTCELATPRDDIEAVVAKLEARFGSPLLEEVEVVGHTPAGLQSAVVFAGRPAALLIEGAPESVTVTGAGRAGSVTYEAPVQSCETPLGALFARRRIAALQDRLILKPFEAEALRPQILTLALGAGLVSEYTGLVAVERSRVVEGTLREIVQPAQLPDGWEAADLAVPVSPAPVFAALAMSPPGTSFFSPGMQWAQDEASSLPPPAMSTRREARLDVKSKAKRGMLSQIADTLGGMLGSTNDAEVDEVVVREEVAAPVGGEPGAVLARTQQADGSFGGDVHRTAAALIALVLLGHTRRKGLRRRTVLKAAAWLAQRIHESDAALALAILEAAERGETPVEQWSHLKDSSAEGNILATL